MYCNWTLVFNLTKYKCLKYERVWISENSKTVQFPTIFCFQTFFPKNNTEIQTLLFRFQTSYVSENQKHKSLDFRLFLWSFNPHHFCYKTYKYIVLVSCGFAIMTVITVKIGKLGQIIQFENIIRTNLVLVLEFRYLIGSNEFCYGLNTILKAE